MPALPKWCMDKPQGSAQKLLLLFVTTFMQVNHNYTPETNHISRVYSVATVLYLQFVLLTYNVVSYVECFVLSNIQERISQLFHFKSYKFIHDI
jgi:hypothetical protein